MRTSLAVLASALMVFIAGVAITQAQSAERQNTENTFEDNTVQQVNGSGAPVVRGATLFAVVTRDGSLARGSGVRRSGRVRGCSVPGTCYEVIFKLNIRHCAYIATIGEAQHFGIEESGEVTTVGRVDDVRGVFLTTSDSAGDRTPRGFHLAVHC